MNITALIVLGVVVLFLIIFAIVFIRWSNKKKSKKLQENLSKYKKENESFKPENKVTIVEDTEQINSSIENNVKNDTKDDFKGKPIIEDYDFDEQTSNFENKSSKINKFEKRKFYSQKQFLNENATSDRMSPNLDNDDFDEFMNEHSYTRKILDNDIMNKLKNLPPEIKAIILSNVFNKYDD